MADLEADVFGFVGLGERMMLPPPPGGGRDCQDMLVADDAKHWVGNSL